MKLTCIITKQTILQALSWGRYDFPTWIIVGEKLAENHYRLSAVRESNHKAFFAKEYLGAPADFAAKAATDITSAHFIEEDNEEDWLQELLAEQQEQF